MLQLLNNPNKQNHLEAAYNLIQDLFIALRTRHSLGALETLRNRDLWEACCGIWDCPGWFEEGWRAGGSSLDWVLSGSRRNFLIDLNNFYQGDKRNESIWCVIRKCKGPLREPRENSILDYVCGGTVFFTLAYV